MKSFLSLSLLVLSLVLASCSGEITTVPNNTPEVYPLKVGNNWEYSEVKNDGTKTDSSTVIDKVMKDSLIEGVLYFSMGDDVWFTNKGDGLYTHHKGKKEKKCKYPIKIGDEMESGVTNYKISVVAINVEIKIKSGTFKCIKYHIDVTEGHKGQSGYHHLFIESYQCPGVGMVKYSLVEEGFDFYKSIFKELLRYTVK